jgi:MFS family permease
MYDKKGFSALVWSTVVSSLFSLFIFGFQNKSIVMLGIILWGIGMGAQESILKAAVSTMIPKASRAAGYGIFELSFGLFWFLGSWILGILYEKSIIAMITLSVVSQLISVPFYIISEKKIKSEQNSEN